MTRVLIADDQRLFREGLRIVLTAHGLDVVADVGSGEEAVALAERLAPDVVLMDLRMPLTASAPQDATAQRALTGGVFATRKIVALPKAPRVIALTTFSDDESVFEVLRAGAIGYLLKDTASSKLVEAIELAGRGEAALEPKVAARVLAEFARTGPAARRDVATELGLSERERTVLEALGRGDTNKQIASALRITEGTVKNHLTSVFAKLQVQDRLQAALKARELGIL
jgi:DNA-binding NarL/FixJ family response regulator